MQAETFEKDFDPAEYDKEMSQMFNDSYYQVEDRPMVDPDDIEKVQENDVDVLRIEQTAEIPASLKEGTQGTWWLCDGCEEGIPENRWRFDCLECPNFTLCEACRAKVVHEHRLKRLKVPLGCAPPSNVVKVLCDDCGKDISREMQFDCTQCDDFSVCEQCLESTSHPHQLKSVQDLWKELEALDYEDMVAGVPCRFKYRQVRPRDYGLTTDEIFEWEDKKLNKLVSLKKIAPYREDDEVKVTKKKKKFVEKSKEKKKKDKKITREESYKTGN
jgi:protein KRI1